MRHRILFGVGAALAALLFLVAIIAGSLWLEARFPSDEPGRALLAPAQRAITDPIARAVGRQATRAWQHRARPRYPETGLTIEETIARFLDERALLSERGVVAWHLAADGSPAAVEALRRALWTGPPEHRAFFAQLLGSTGNRRAVDWLLPLLDDPDQRVLRGAIRGLGALGGDAATDRIAAILADDRLPPVVRSEAARGLGGIGTPAARDALVAAFATVPEDTVALQIIDSLGRFPFPSVAGAFADYLAASDVPPALRVAAVEALAHSSADAASFLLGLAARDQAADVRAAAAWALSAQLTVTDLGPPLAVLAEQEPEPDVRRRLYEALLPQAEIPGERLLPLVTAEQDIAARVAGFNAVARATRLQPASPVAAAFDRDIVPELVRIATAPNSLNLQMRAVFALRRAQTPAAQTALATIAKAGRPQVAAAARNGLRPATS